MDLDGDQDLDVMVRHTRWEGVDLSWAGLRQAVLKSGLEESL